MLKLDIHLESLYTELPFEARFAAAKKNGYDFVKLWDWDNKGLPQVKELLDTNGLKPAAMSGDGPYSMCDPKITKDYMDYIARAIEVAKIVESPHAGHSFRRSGSMAAVCKAPQRRILGSGKISDHV